MRNETVTALFTPTHADGVPTVYAVHGVAGVYTVAGCWRVMLDGRLKNDSIQGAHLSKPLSIRL